MSILLSSHLHFIVRLTLIASMAYSVSLVNRRRAAVLGHLKSETGDQPAELLFSRKWPEADGIPVDMGLLKSGQPRESADGSRGRPMAGWPAGSSVPWDRRPDGGGHDHGGPGQSPCRRPRLAPGQDRTSRIARSHAPSGGKSTLGFRTPSGSRARLRARNVEISLALRERYSHRLLAAPMPCSALMLPPKSPTIRSTPSSTRSSSGGRPLTFTWTLPSPG